MMHDVTSFYVRSKCKKNRATSTPHQTFRSCPERASKLKVNLCYANVPKMTVLTQLLGLSIYIDIFRHINPIHSPGHFVCEWLEWDL